MTISGYTFVRNATKLAFPFKESLLSILDLVDEFVIAYSPGDEDDNTLGLIESIGSNKIKVVHADWNPERFKKNTLYSHLSDIAKHNCQGDWLFYLQADEVIHEKYLEIIKNACQHYLENDKVEGLLLNYRHFWGDYDHCFTHHGWYPKEIRIIRNNPAIHSWRDAQSFRLFDDFAGNTENYQKKEGTHKLKVVAIPAYVFHYGWVRNPIKMRIKQNRMVETWDPNRLVIVEKSIDYGPLSRIPLFTGSHPLVMQEKISSMNWQDSLQYTGKIMPGRPKNKHEKFRYRIKSWIEINLLGGWEIGGFKNYKIVEKFKNS
jgi:glycosyltransferase involved in cell wall biosynthesis